MLFLMTAIVLYLDIVFVMVCISSLDGGFIDPAVENTRFTGSNRRESVRDR